MPAPVETMSAGICGQRQLLLRHADDDAADDVDEGDDQAGDRVAADELRGAVHGAEEGAFVLQHLAPRPRLGLVDQAGRQVGVDRHLLARHGVEAEPRRHLGDAARPLGDDDEVHQHQDGEDDEADDEVAAHDELAERLDDAAGGGGSFVAVGEDETGRGQVEGQPQHRRDQEDGGEGAEVERPLDEQHRHQDQHGEGDREGEADVEQPRRHRQDQHDQNADHAERERDLSAAQDLPEAAEQRCHLEAACRRRVRRRVSHRFAHP